MSLKRDVLTVIVFCLVTMMGATYVHAIEPLDSKALAKALDELIDTHPVTKRTNVTLKVVDLESGEVLYDRGGDRLLTPASNLKIYTAAAALDLLGPEYTWTTEVLATEAIKNHVCNGSLVIRGTGDPMLDTEQLAAMADQVVKKHKLRMLNGPVKVLESDRWENVPIKGPGWMWDDDPDYYNMSIRSVMLNFNTIKFTVKHDKDGINVSQEPPSSWPQVKVVSRPVTEANKVSYDRAPFSEAITINARLEPGAAPVSDTITMHDPSPWISSVFDKMLQERGVETHGRMHNLAVEFRPKDDRVLVSHQGKTMAEALRHFLKVSENAVGEMVLLKLAETQTEGDVSWPAGAKVISDWLVETAGLEAGSFRLVDGSGLSRYNLISADSSIRLLQYMKTHEHFEPFFDGMPVRKVKLPAEGSWGGVPFAEFDQERVFAKSGGMSGVATLSGYVKTLDGRWLAFSFLSNGYIGSNKPVLGLRNAVYTELVRYRPAEVPAGTNR